MVLRGWAKQDAEVAEAEVQARVQKLQQESWGTAEAEIASLRAHLAKATQHLAQVL